ncbi:MAG: PHP domain-containing protein [Burkholderiaceae bacterium]|nr:MAG: PHP domain-containing protein [Burkholderiaceae bacterium]
MTTPANADLHCHSIFSDGTLTPEDVAARASGHGVDLWALTDHDGVGGQQRALQAAREHGMHYLTGVEVSITYADTTVHIVGLGFDPANPDLVAGLDATRGGRDGRAREVANRLERLTGITGVYAGALRYAGNKEAIARPHFARFLVDQGVCKSTQDAFIKYLGDGQPAFVPHRWARLSDAVTWITAAGGIAIVAHPARYRFNATQEAALFTDFKDCGGQGVEVVTGSHTAAEAVRYAATARRYGLLASRGSDFHGPGESRTDVGTLPPLPADLRPVWTALAERIQ